MRADQLQTFVVIATGQAAVWLPSRSLTGIYHASVDGLRACCNRSILVAEDGSEIFEDRSDCTMTCDACARRVKRLRGERKPVDVDAALRRHAARSLGVRADELGRRFR